MLETINKNQVNVILNKNTDEIATLIEKHRNTMITSKKIIKLIKLKKLFKYTLVIIALSLLIIAIPLYLVTLVILIISSISILKSII